MRLAVDPPGQPADDYEAGSGQLPPEHARDLGAVRRARTCSDHAHRSPPEQLRLARATEIERRRRIEDRLQPRRESCVGACSFTARALAAIGRPAPPLGAPRSRLRRPPAPRRSGRRAPPSPGRDPRAATARPLCRRSRRLRALHGATHKSAAGRCNDSQPRSKCRRRSAQLGSARARQRDDEVEAVEQRAGELLAKGQPLWAHWQSAPASPRPPRTHVHAGDELEACRKDRPPPTRATAISPSSSGWRSASSTGRWNSGSSSRRARLDAQAWPHPASGPVHPRRRPPLTRCDGVTETGACRSMAARGPEDRRRSGCV